MLRNLNVTTGGRRILGTPYVGILAEQIAADTATGDSGPGLLYDESINPLYAGKLLRLRVATPPSAGNLFVWEDGQHEFTDAPDGSYSLVYERFVDNVSIGMDTATYLVGLLDATFAGATLTSATSISAGALSGEQSATLAGETLTAASSITAGAMSGAQNAALASATLTATATIAAGAMTGGVAGDATLSGTSLFSTGSISPGALDGQRHGAITGAELVAQASIIAGGITGGTGTGVDAVFPGATLSTGSGGTYPSAESIAAAILAAAQVTPIHSDVQRVRSQSLVGSGVELDPWGPA